MTPFSNRSVRSHRYSRRGFRPMVEALEGRTVPAQLLILPESSISFDKSPNLISDAEFSGGEFEYAIVKGSQWASIELLPRLWASEDGTSPVSMTAQGTLKLRIVPDEGEDETTLVGIEIGNLAGAIANVIDPGSLTGQISASVKWPTEDNFSELGPYPSQLWTTYSSQVSIDNELYTYWYGVFGYDFGLPAGSALAKRNVHVDDVFELNYFVTFSAAPGPNAIGWTAVQIDGVPPFLAWLRTGGGPSVSVVAPFPDIVVADATTKDLANRRKIDVEYEIKDAKASPFKLSVYQSADAIFDEGDKAHFIGEQPIAAKKDLAVTEPDKPHKKTLKLPSWVPAINITKALPFIIVVANEEGKAAVELDATNNDAFVIPIFKLAKKQYAGFNAAAQSFQFQLTESSAVLPIVGRISRGTDDFDRLLGQPDNDISALWANNGGTFALPDSPPYAGDDGRVQSTLRGPLQAFVDLIDLTKSKDPARLTTSLLAITDSFDEQGDHGNNSLHYEGRGIDFDADNAALPRLAGLAVLAGFDWVYLEPDGPGSFHLHVSHNGDRASDVSADGVLQAIEFGRAGGLITTDAMYQGLKDRMLLVKSLVDAGLADDGAKDQAREAINDFKALVFNDYYADSGHALTQGFRLITRPRSPNNPDKEPTHGYLWYEAGLLWEELGL